MGRDRTDSPPMTSRRARRGLLRLRLRTLLDGQDIAGAYLLSHHLLWLAVLLLPGSTLGPAQRPDGTRSSTALFVELGGDPALATTYAVMLILALVGVLRLSVRTDVQRGCLLVLLAMSVSLAAVYLAGSWRSIIAWDALLRAVMAWWAFTSIDPVDD